MKSHLPTIRRMQIGWADVKNSTKLTENLNNVEHATNTSEMLKKILPNFQSWGHVLQPTLECKYDGLIKKLADNRSDVKRATNSNKNWRINFVKFPEMKSQVQLTLEYN